MNSLIFLLIAATAPVIAGLGYIFAKDRYNKEPLHMLLGAFILGAISSIPICIVELILIVIGAIIIPANNNLLVSAWSAFIVAAATEECFKLTALYAYVWKSPEFDERFDGIVYGVFVSLGFACAENILYVFGNLYSDGIASAFSTSISRAAFSIPCHFFCGVILGYYLSLAKFEQTNTSFTTRGSAIFKGLLFAILFHGIYDFIVFYSGSFNATPNDTNLTIGTALPSSVFIFIFLVFNILFWKHCYKRIQHMASLLRPNHLDEPSAMVTCAHCGTTYLSDLDACPNCKMLTAISAQNQNNPDSSWMSQYLHDHNSFSSNHECERPPRDPHDL